VAALPGGGTDNGPLGCAAAADTPAAHDDHVASVVRISRDKWCMIVFFLTSGSSNFQPSLLAVLLASVF
jgi:hypothetical protein